MKLKKLVVVLAIAVLAVAIPLWAVVAQEANEGTPGDYIRDGITFIGDIEPTVSFSVYGYGTVTATSALGSIASGSQIPNNTSVTFRAEGISTSGFEFTGWQVNGAAHSGTTSPTLTLTITEDTNVMAMFNHPWANQASPPPSAYTSIPMVNAALGNNGQIVITIPGITGQVTVQTLPAGSTTEFRVTPPANRYFSADTELNLADHITRTFGPVVQTDGRLMFTILSANANSNIQQTSDSTSDDDSSDYEEATYFAVVFDPAGGTMPAGAQPVQSLRYNYVINQLPTPVRGGYTFTGWRLNSNNLAAAPITVTSDLDFTAEWAADTSAQFVAAFNPSPGTFPGTGETGLRPGNYGTVVTNMPQNPTRTGYTFGGWRLPNGNTLVGQLTITSDMAIAAIWTANTSASPSPSPNPTPTPTPAQSGQRPNPQTSPLHISFMIFGVVVIGGTAAFGIMKLAQRQAAAEGKYLADMARFKRESRIIDLVDKE